MLLARNMSVTEERPQPTQAGFRVRTAAQRLARPTRRCCGSSRGASTNSSPNRASTVAVAARAAGRRAAPSLIPKRRKLSPTIQ